MAWRYPAQTFVAYIVAGVIGESVGDWAACRICHGLIEAGDRSGLLDRTICSFLEKNPDMRPAETELRNQIAEFHRLFYANQTGEALPVA